MNSFKFLAAASLAAMLSPAYAVYTVDIAQSGANVVMTRSGTIDTTGLNLQPGVGTCDGFGRIYQTGFCVGLGNTATYASNALNPPITGFNSGPFVNADAASGAALYGAGTFIYLPAGYVSNAPINNSSTFTNRTVSQLGLTPGTRQTYTLPSGDTLVFQVAAAPPDIRATAVPTLATSWLAAMAGAIALLGWGRLARRRQRQ